MNTLVDSLKLTLLRVTKSLIKGSLFILYDQEMAQSRQRPLLRDSLRQFVPELNIGGGEVSLIQQLPI